MSQWLIALICISAGLGWGLLAFAIYSYFTWKSAKPAGEGQGFFTSPKGDVFTIRDGVDEVSGLPPGAEEPSKEEQNMLKRTESFLKSLGGEA